MSRFEKRTKLVISAVILAGLSVIAVSQINTFSEDNDGFGNNETDDGLINASNKSGDEVVGTEDNSSLEGSVNLKRVNGSVYRLPVGSDAW